MRLPKWLRRKEDDKVGEERARRERLEAERKLRETSEQWSQVNEAADAVAKLRRSDRDPFLDELAGAMRPRPHHHHRREA